MYDIIGNFLSWKFSSFYIFSILIQLLLNQSVQIDLVHYYLNSIYMLAVGNLWTAGRWIWPVVVILLTA